MRYRKMHRKSSRGLLVIYTSNRVFLNLVLRKHVIDGAPMMLLLESFLPQSKKQDGPSCSKQRELRGNLRSIVKYSPPSVKRSPLGNVKVTALQSVTALYFNFTIKLLYNFHFGNAKVTALQRVTAL